MTLEEFPAEPQGAGTYSSYLFKNSNASRIAICFNLKKKKKARKKTNLKTLLPSAINFVLECNIVRPDCKLSLKFTAADSIRREGGSQVLTGVCVCRVCACAQP